MAQVPSDAGFLSVQTGGIGKLFTLPLSTDLIGRVITFKDSTGNAQTGSIYIQTQGGDTFQDGTTTYVIQEAWGSATFVSRSGFWVLQQGNAQVIASSIVTTNLTVAQSNVAFYMSSVSAYTDYQLVQTSLAVADGAASITNSNGLLPFNLVLDTYGPRDVVTLYGNQGNGSWTTKVTNNNSHFGFGLYQRPDEVMTLLSTGKVGIMTSSPQYTLDVSGMIFASSLATVSVAMVDVTSQQFNFLTTSSGVLLLNGAGITGGTGGAGVSQIVAGSNISISPIGGTGVVTVNATGGLTDANLTSSLVGIGTLGFISSSSLTSTVRGLGGFGYISSLSLTSTIEGLGTFGYISSASLASSIVSTTNAITFGVIELLDNLGTSPGYISSLSLFSTVEGLGSAGYLSTGGQGRFSSLYVNLDPQTAPAWDSNTPPIAGFDTQPEPLAVDVFGSLRILKNLYIGSTTTVIGTSGLQTNTIRLQTLSAATTVVSSLGIMNSATNQPAYLTLSNGNLVVNGQPVALGTMGSTIEGLGTYGYVSTLSLNSSIGAAISSFSTAFGPGGITLTNITSTVTGLGSAGFVSTLSLTSSLISTTNAMNTAISSFSTAFGPGGISLTNITSTVTGLGSAGYASTLSVTSSINAAISSFSTAFSPLVPTVLNLRSTVAGLGQVYLSSPPLLLSTSGLFTSSVIASTITTSSLQVNSLTIGTGTGWVNLGPLQTVALSSIQINTNDAYLNNVYVGIQSTMNDVMFYGLFGNYNNTVLAEVSTGAGTQELLMFKGSSTSDRVRVQTTGTFVVETGVSARLFNSNTTQTLSNATPAFIINTSSNVGIQTASPGAALDVAGTVRAITLSSQQLFVSSFNGDVPITRSNEVSTVIGLGSAGYVSTLSLTSSLVSTTFGLQTSGFLSSPVLLSTVTGLGSAGYISSLQFQASFSSFSTAISTRFETSSLTASDISTINITTNTLSNNSTTTKSLGLYDNTLFVFNYLTTSSGVLLLNNAGITGGTGGGGLQPISLVSTVAGLGSSGYVSTLSLNSSIAVAISSFSTAFGPGGAGGLTITNLASTVTGLGSAGYMSSIPAIVSTTQFFASSAVISTGLFTIVSTLVLNASTVTTTQITTSTIATNGITLATSPSWILTSPIQTLAVSTNTLWAAQAYFDAATITTGTVSSVTTNAVTLGTGGTWIQTSPIQTSVLSSVFMFASQPFFDTVNVGVVSTVNSIEYYGLFGNYNNTVLAEISTGGGAQELLMFKGSSTSDRVRVQTTGTFVVETGVSARLFNSNTTQTLSNATPAFVINASSNVGIQTASPGATLDVAGTARAVTLSSQQLFVSSFNGDVPIVRANEVSTVAGLGQIYLSTIPSIVSTTALLTSSLLASTVTASSIFTSTITGSQSQFGTLSSLALFASSIVAPYIFAAQFFTF